MVMPPLPPRTFGLTVATLLVVVGTGWVAVGAGGGGTVRMASLLRPLSYGSSSAGGEQGARPTAELLTFIVAARERSAAALDAAAAADGLTRTRLARGLTSVGDLTAWRRLFVKAARRTNDTRITIGVFGGSTAAGAQLASSAEIFAVVFADFVGRVLRVPVTVLNMAVGATASDYYALCGGQHVREDADVVLAELALNDLANSYGPWMYKPHEASVVEQVVQQVRRHAPGAVLAYAGVQPQDRQCHSGEDLPGLNETLRRFGAAVVSARNLVLGPPAGWAGGRCDVTKLDPPFAWDTMFPGGGGHPRQAVHRYVALLLAAAMTEALGAVANGTAAAWGGDGAPPPPAPVPLHDGSHARPCLGGPLFDCRTALSPRFGAPLRPLPSACVVMWSGRVPSFDVATCGAAAWSDARIASPAPPPSDGDAAAADELPVVDGWHRGTAGFDGTGANSGAAAATVRADRKDFWAADAAPAGTPPRAIRFPVRVGPRGAVAVAYFTAQAAGTAEFTLVCGAEGTPCGGAAASRSSASGAFGYRITKTAVVAEGAAPGMYVLEVRALGGKPFQVVAVAGA